MLPEIFIRRRIVQCVPRAARCGGFFGAVVVCFVFVAAPGQAQQGVGQLPNLTADQLQQLQQQYGQQSAQNGSAVGPAVPQLPTVLQPAQPNAASPLPATRLEQIISARAGVQLSLFGYDQLGRAATVSVPQTGAVQDDYILGPGDEIVAVLRGQENNEAHATVDRNGQIVLPRLSPIAATGRNFGSVRQDVEAAIRRAYVATTGTVSVGRMRQISVQVSGEVNVPGQRLVTGLSSAVDALLLSGGIKKTGSLRNVRVIRGGRQYDVDLYSVLTGRGNSSNMRLADGDRIVVPLLGPTVAITGIVRQPGIYELAAGQKSTVASDLMALAGGEEVRSLYRLSLLRIDADGRTTFVSLPNSGAQVRDSEILFVQFGADQTVNRAMLSGGTALAGSYPITPGTKLSDILKAPGALGPEPYTLLGIISRRDYGTQLRTLTAFTPIAVLHGLEDMVMQSDDIVRVISVDEARVLTTTAHDFKQLQTAQQEALRNPAGAELSGTSIANAVSASSAIADDQPAQSQDVVQSLGSRTITGRTGAPPATAGGGATLDYQNQLAPRGYASNREVTSFSQMAQQLFVDQLVLTNFLIDHEAVINGAVRGPGTYFIGSQVLLQDLVAAAGGLSNRADNSNVEIITTTLDPSSGRAVTQQLHLAMTQGVLSSYIVKPRDEIRFNQIFTDTDVGSVLVQGEVRFAGNYKLRRGERLSEVLSRAGGLTNVAYPYGAVFLRKSVAALERDGYVRVANEVENQLVVAMTRIGNDKIDPGTFASLRTFVGDLRNQKALGRISIVADPSVLASRPSLDPVLEADDVIYIPPRPSTISVLGQVMQAGSFTYEPKSTVADYIQRAGGYSRFADESQTFIVLPDGSARKVERSWLRAEATALPPGSAIIVPRDVTPLDMRQIIIDVSQIFSQLAVSIASVAVLSKQ